MIRDWTPHHLETKKAQQQTAGPLHARQFQRGTGYPKDHRTSETKPRGKNARPPCPIPRLNPSHLIQIRRGFEQKNAKKRKETLVLVLGNADIFTRFFCSFETFTPFATTISTPVFFCRYVRRQYLVGEIPLRSRRKKKKNQP